VTLGAESYVVHIADGTRLFEGHSPSCP
jgi:hypothetical protein